MNLIYQFLFSSWEILQESSLYVLFGILLAGLMRAFIHPAAIARHLGKGRFASVFKAALLGIPLPLCSCGVLPAAASLKKQGANKGATTAFLISTPESGIDSIAISYALLDPLMTIARPVAAFITAIAAGITENLISFRKKASKGEPDLSCTIDACCDGNGCPPTEHANHHPWNEKIKAGTKYAFGELWPDLAGWFLLGILLAGLITAFVPQEILSEYLGGGLLSMLAMLAVGIPLYICATASTPIAAALILKGVSPGAALVFLLAGPATNIASLTVLTGILGKRALAVYITMISVSSVLMGLLLDHIYHLYAIPVRAVTGEASEFFPVWLRIAGAVVLLAMSIKPVFNILKSRVRKFRKGHDKAEPACDCKSGCDV